MSPSSRSSMLLPTHCSDSDGGGDDDDGDDDDDDGDDDDDDDDVGNVCVVDKARHIDEVDGKRLCR